MLVPLQAMAPLVGLRMKVNVLVPLPAVYDPSPELFTKFSSTGCASKNILNWLEIRITNAKCVARAVGDWIAASFAVNW